MRKLWLLAALLLPLLPSPAAASEPAPASGGERYQVAPGHGFGDQVRAGTGFEILGQQGRGEARSPRAPLPAAGAPEPSRLRPHSSAVRGDALPAPEGSTPLCEHLPYDATAPPHRG